MKSLGGSLFVRNAIKYDYCIEEAVLSLVPICDEITIGDAGSDDGTLDVLRKLESDHNNIKVIEWEREF